MAKSIIVIELSQETMAVVEITNRNSGAELLRYTVRSLPPTGLTSTWLKAVWHQEHFAHRRVILSLPAAAVDYKSVEVPILPFPELEKAVKLELTSTNNQENNIYKIISYQKVEQLYQVKVAVVTNKKLTELISFMHQAGLEVIWSGLRNQGIQSFVNFNAGFFEESNQGLSYLDFSDEQTEFGIMQDETVVYRRILGITYRDLKTDEGDSISDFLEEIGLSIASYQAETKTFAPVKIGLFGKVEVASSFKNALVEQFGFTLYIPEKSNLTGVLTHQYTPELVPLIGLALDELGLCNQRILKIYSADQEREKANQRRLLMSAGIGAIAILFITGLVLGMRANLEKEYRIDQWLKTKAVLLNNLRHTENETRLAEKEINNFETWLAAQGQELDFLLILDQNLPPGTKITDLIIEDGVVKDFVGETPSVSLLLSKLKSVPELRNLKLKGTISTTDQGEGFQLEGIISGKEPTK